jgi:hypothetical protein
MYERLVEVRGQLAELVTAVDPDAVSGSTARELWAEFDRIERLGAAGKTLLARRVAATHRADRSGSRTAAEELARKAGTTAGTAKDAVDTSHRLADQPELDQAVRRGEVSPVQAALVSAAAAADPSAGQRLVELAPRVSVAELRAECARVTAAADPDPEATNRRIHAQRRLRHYRDGEGGWNLSARGTAHAGAAFVTVLNAITDTLFTAARRAGRNEPVEAYAFDALMTMADHTAESTTTADPKAWGGAGSAGRAGDPGIASAAGGESGSGCATRPRPSTSPRYLGLLRVDVAALRRGRVQGGELCELAGVGPIPVSGAKELLGEAIVKLVITDGVDVLNVTHLGRGPTAAQRAGLLWMNPSCSVDGCHRTRVEWDHREPWAQTRHTRLDGLDPLCSFHHDLKTRFGWALVPGKGNRAFVPPDDPRHPSYRKPQVSSHVPTPKRPGRRQGQQPRRRHSAKPAHPEPPARPPPHR